MSRWQSIRDSFRWWFGLLAGVWLLAAAVVIALALYREQSDLGWPLVLYAGATLAASLFAFGAYGVDKRRAGRGGRRVPERVLQAAALLGGWPGAFLAQQVFRHKTLKATFRVVFWLIVLLHAGVLGWCAYHAMTASPAAAAVSK